MTPMTNTMCNNMFSDSSILIIFRQGVEPASHLHKRNPSLKAPIHEVPVFFLQMTGHNTLEAPAVLNKLLKRMKTSC